MRWSGAALAACSSSSASSWTGSVPMVFRLGEFVLELFQLGDHDLDQVAGAADEAGVAAAEQAQQCRRAGPGEGQVSGPLALSVILLRRSDKRAESLAGVILANLDQVAEDLAAGRDICGTAGANITSAVPEHQVRILRHRQRERSVNRRLSPRWFEPNTCHPVSAGQSRCHRMVAPVFACGLRTVGEGFLGQLWARSGSPLLLEFSSNIAFELGKWRSLEWLRLFGVDVVCGPGGKVADAWRTAPRSVRPGLPEGCVVRFNRWPFGEVARSARYAKQASEPKSGGE
jgi:hypothetical protein